MIRTIRSITRFGIFQDFMWETSTPPFERYNIIYGWNYSGKTTLSRIFRALEKGIRHEDYDVGATAVLSTDDPDSAVCYGTPHGLSV